MKNTYLSKNNVNYRFGGKLLIISPQKDDPFWMALRASVGRNDETNQGYLTSELINTFRVNDWIAINISPKYFSGEGFFIGCLNVHQFSDNIQFIPEINSTFKIAQISIPH